MNINSSKRNEIMHSKGSKMNNIVKPKDETLLSIKELTGSARALLDIYYSVNSAWDFHDNHMAKTMGVGVRTYKLMRKELIDKKYLYIAKGPEVNNYYVGKKAVAGILKGKENGFQLGLVKGE